MNLAEREARGETIKKKNGATVVHGRVLAAEFLAEYDQLIEEHNTLYRTVSPFRSDYAEIDALITADLAECAERLAYAVNAWREDAELEKAQRDAAICREIELADRYDQ